MSTKGWKPSVSEEAPDEETLKRYKLVVEQISETHFRQCMLARNVASGGPPATEVTNYYKGSDLVAFMIGSSDVASGLNEIETEEAATSLLDKILTAHLTKKSIPGKPDAIKQVSPPLMIRVNALREELTKEQRIAAIAKAKKADPDVDPKAVEMPKGKVQRRDGMPVFFPTTEDASKAANPDSHPVRLTEGGSYVFIHRKDMSSTAYWYFAVIAAIGFAWMTFRLWPAFLQLWVWYLSVTVLVVILGFHAIQFLIFLLCYTVGFELWIFPKMFDERYHVTEWFTDVIDVEWTGGSWILRVGVAGLFVAAIVWVQFLSAAEVSEMGEHSVQFVEELYSGKLLEGAAPSQFGINGKRIPTFEELERLAEEEANEAAAEPTEATDGGEAASDAASSETASADQAQEESAEEEEEDEEDGDSRQSLEEALLAELSSVEDEGEDNEDGDEL